MPAIQQLCPACQQERKQFSAEGDKHSPACAALWRLAFAKDEDAWQCVQTIFEPWVKARCSAALQQAPKISGLSREDLPDLVQDVWHNLWRYNVNNPNEAQKLVSNDDLSRVIGLLKTTIKNRVVELCRRPHGYAEPLPSDDGPSADDGEAGKPKLPRIDPPDPVPVLDLLALLRRHIQTAKEYIIAELIFLQGMKPQDVLDLHPEHFTGIKDVNQAQQTLLRRIRGDSARQKPDDSASLEFRLDHNEVRMNVFEPCPFAEDILLDYVNGQVSAEIRRAIDRSPACRQAVAALQADLAAWRPALRQLFCPASEQLVAYQERRLTATDHLVIHNHVQQCPYCTAEMQMLAAVDAPEASLIRRIYELLFLPATMAPVPVLGEGSYRTIERTPQIELLVRTTKAYSNRRSWSLFGRLRYENAQPFLQVEGISMRDLEDEEQQAYSATIDEHGAFTIKGLSAGTYQLRVIAGDEEIILNDFKVGEQF